MKQSYPGILARRNCDDCANRWGKKSVRKSAELQIDTLELPSDQKKSLRRRRKSFMAEEYLHMTISKLLSGSITILFGFGMSPKRTTNVYVLLYASMEDNSTTLIEINNAVAMGNSIEQRSPDYSFQIDITSLDNLYGFARPQEQMLRDCRFTIQELEEKGCSYGVQICLWSSPARIDFGMMTTGLGEAIVNCLAVKFPNPPKSACPPLDYVGIIKNFKVNKYSHRRHEMMRRDFLCKLFSYLRVA